MIIKCLVLGCTNQSDQGTMAGALCAPCDDMLRRGSSPHGLNWVADLARKNIELCDALRSVERTARKALS